MGTVADSFEIMMRKRQVLGVPISAMVPESSADRLLVGVVVVAVVSLLYSLLIARAPLVWVGVAFPLAFLYLAWRFVRAHERIAAALERSG
jgi:hypothetical protein